MQEDEARRIHWDDQIGQAKLSSAIEQQEMTLFTLLQPQLYQDGNQWCVLYGEDIQSGIVGFGDTPRKAILAWNKEWDASKYPEQRRG